MTTVKVKFRPSTVANRPGSIIYLVTRHRVVRQITSDCKVFPEEWDERQSKVVLAHKERTNAILSVAHRLSNDMEHLNEVIDRLNHTETDFTTDDVVRCFYESDTNPSLFRFMEDVITHLKHLGRERTSETYTTALRSFMHFRNGEDVYLNEMDSELIMEYQAYLKSRHVSLNTISFYNRILRAVYNRAVEKDLAVQRYPFRHVYTGVCKTVKRAIPLEAIRRIKELSLPPDSSLDFARNMFLFSFYGWAPPADLDTFGYYFFRKTSEATTNNDKQALCTLSALGLIFSAMAIPLTFGVRYLLNRYGPKED